MNRTTYTLEQSAEQAGSAMACDLLNELLQLKDQPQSKALQAIHDKLYTLSMLQPFDCAAAGFAVALVDVLQIGIANLPAVGEQEATPQTTPNPQSVYQHPEGAAILFHADGMYLACHHDIEGDRDDFILVNIGPDGLIQLGQTLIAIGHGINKKVDVQ